MNVAEIVVRAAFAGIVLTIAFRYAGRQFGLLMNAVSQVRVRLDGGADARRELAEARAELDRIRSSRRVDVIVTGTMGGSPVTLGQSLDLGFDAEGDVRFGPLYAELDAGAHVLCFGGYMSDVLVGIDSMAIYSDNVGMRLAVTSKPVAMGVQLTVRVRREIRREYYDSRERCC